MFEKEAEEVCSKYFEENCYKKNKWADTHDLVVMWQDGYNKANEWHRVDEGKYPNKEQLGESFIVAFAFNERTQKYYSFDCAEYIDKGKFCTHTNNDDKVIAWKEIVLSKESK